MAQRLNLPANSVGMKFIYNVSKHVGPFNSNPNDMDDVQLVQFLLREVIKAEKLELKSGIDVPKPTGLFDTATGFWIFRVQATFLAQHSVVDGIVSPAKGILYSTAPWAISFLNARLKKLAPVVFDTLPDNAELRPTLRASLKG